MLNRTSRRCGLRRVPGRTVCHGRGDWFPAGSYRKTNVDRVARYCVLVCTLTHPKVLHRFGFEGGRDVSFFDESLLLCALLGLRLLLLVESVALRRGENASCGRDGGHLVGWSATHTHTHTHARTTRYLLYGATSSSHVMFEPTACTVYLWCLCE